MNILFPMDPRSYNHNSQPRGPPPGYPAYGPSMSGPHTSHGDTGSYYPSPGYPAFPAPTHGGPMLPHPSNAMPMLQYREREKVSVRITADTWVIGIIVGIVHICSKFTGRTYKVEIDSMDRSGRREIREFSHDELMPYRQGK